MFYQKKDTLKGASSPYTSFKQRIQRTDLGEEGDAQIEITIEY